MYTYIFFLVFILVLRDRKLLFVAGGDVLFGFIIEVKWFLGEKEKEGDQLSLTECNNIITSFASTVIYLRARTQNRTV